MPDPILEKNTTESLPPLSNTLTDDPLYQEIRQKINADWLKQSGAEEQSGDHQDFLYGNPGQRDVPTLDQLTEQEFSQQHPDRAKEYGTQEDKRVYPNYRDDPAYKDMETRVTVETNEVMQSPSGKSLTHSSLLRRKWITAINAFINKYPEKAEAYAEQWERMSDGLERKHKREEKWQRERELEQQRQAEEREISEKLQQDQVEQARLKLEALLSGKQPLELTESRAESSNDQVLNKREQLDPQEAMKRIQASIPDEMRQVGEAELLQAQEKLRELPFIPSKDTGMLINSEGEDEGSMMIKTDAIVGSGSAAFDDWSTEYEARKGRAVNVAKSLLEGSEDGMERVFHMTTPEQGVKVKKFSGPAGDLFFVVDGNHRVAGSKLAQAGEIPAQVENMNSANEVKTTSRSLVDEWEKRIKKGLIKGEVAKGTSPSGQEEYTLQITEQVLPWMALPQHKIHEMAKVYANLYPESLTGLKNYKTNEPIPLEVLTDEIGMNYFLAGRWNEYEQILEKRNS